MGSPQARLRLYRLATYHCCVAGCSRSFKSEPALKRHQTNTHVVPEALRPQQRPNTNPQDNSEPPHIVDTDADHLGTPPPPQYEMVDGFSVEKHPILDGEHCPLQLASTIHVPPQEHHAM